MNAPTVKRWWLAIDGRADGPRTATFISAALQSGQINATTQICPEGGKDWIPINRCNEFASTTTSSSAPPLPPTPSPSINYDATHKSLVTNPALPQTANWICMFVIVLLPLYWIFGALSSLAMIGPSDPEVVEFLYGLLFHGPITLALTVALAIGGLRLRDLRASGARLLKLALLADIGFSVVNFLLSLALLVFFMMRSDTEVESSGVAMFLTIVLAFVGIVALVCELVAFFWLQKHAVSLPLDSRR